MKRLRISITAVAVILAVACMCLLAGCASGGGASATAQARTLAAAGLPKLSLIASRVQRIRGLRFNHLPPVALVTRRQFAAELQRQLANAPSPSSLPPAQRAELQLEQRQVNTGMVELGLLGAIPKHFAQSQSAAAGADLYGQYNPQTGRIMLIEQPGESRTWLQDVLSHELLHALEAQNFHSPREPAPTNPVAFAARALVEGSAVIVQYDYAVRFLGERGSLAAFLRRRYLGSPPRGLGYLLEQEMFPYVQGSLFVHALVSQAHGWTLVNRAEAQPPTTTQQILQPKLYLSQRAASGLTVDDGSLLAPHAWKLMDSRPLPEFSAAALLTPGMVPGLHATAATGWGGGRLQLWQQTNAPPCADPCAGESVVILAARWDGPQAVKHATRELARYMRRVLHVRAPGAGGATSTASHAFLSVRGPDTTLVLAPTTQLARRIATATVPRPTPSVS